MEMSDTGHWPLTLALASPRARAQFPASLALQRLTRDQPKITGQAQPKPGPRINTGVSSRGEIDRQLVRQYGNRSRMAKKSMAMAAAAAKAKPHANRLLGLLSPKDYGRLRPHLQHIPLAYKQSLYSARKAIGFVYFIETGVGSLVNTMANGQASEVGTPCFAESELSFRSDC